MIDYTVEETYYTSTDTPTIKYIATVYGRGQAEAIEYFFNLLNRHDDNLDFALSCIKKEVNTKYGLQSARNGGCRHLSPKDNRILEAMLALQDIVYSGPCTILFTDDGRKTIVRCTKTEKFDHEKGAMMAFLKRYLGWKEWKSFTTEYHDTPKKEKDAAKALIIVMFGREAYDILMAKADGAWERSKK